MQVANIKAAAIVAAVALSGAAVRQAAAAEYQVDPNHTSIVFRIQHAGVSNVYGRFNKVEGAITIDESDASKNTFLLTIAADSIDTGVERRDGHLRSDDFFDTKQFPTITFASTKVEAVEGGWSVTGDLTMHGVSKSITFTVTNGGATEFPPGTKRIGVGAEFTVNRKDFGVGGPKFDGALAEEVHVMIGMEATAK